MSYPEYTLAGILRSGHDCYVVNLSRLLVHAITLCITDQLSMCLKYKSVNGTQGFGALCKFKTWPLMYS
jgi:hypothetical protein